MSVKGILPLTKGRAVFIKLCFLMWALKIDPLPLGLILSSCLHVSGEAVRWSSTLWSTCQCNSGLIWRHSCDHQERKASLPRDISASAKPRPICVNPLMCFFFFLFFCHFLRETHQRAHFLFVRAHTKRPRISRPLMCRRLLVMRFLQDGKLQGG